MAKRPRFEELNYPDDKPGWGTWAATVVVVVVIITAVYFGYHYWYSCSDFGFFKFCSAIKKPV